MKAYLFLITLIPARLIAGLTDIGVKYILSPEMGGDPGEHEITVSVHNFGDSPVSDFSISWVMDGGAVITEDFPGVILEGDTAVYTYSVTIYLDPGIHSMCSWTNYIADEFHENDSSCSDVSLFAPPLVEFGPDSTGCEGLLLDAGNPGWLFLWNTGETTQTKMIDVTGTYWVVVTNPDGETGSDTIDIIIEATPDALFEYSIAGTTTVSFTNLTAGADEYAWDFGDGEYTSEENPIHVFDSSGAYMVSLTASNNCSSDFQSQVILISLVMSDEEFKNIYSMHPNPANELLIINSDLQFNTFFELTDAAGRKISNGSFSDTYELHIENLPAGIYTIRLFSENQETMISKQFVKN